MLGTILCPEDDRGCVPFRCLVFPVALTALTIALRYLKRYLGRENETKKRQQPERKTLRICQNDSHLINVVHKAR